MKQRKSDTTVRDSSATLIATLAALTAALLFNGAVLSQVYGQSRTRLSEPRIHPAQKAEWSEAQREFLSGYEASGRLFNVFTTMAKHPDLARDWVVFGGYILGESTLSARDREMLILRIGWLCQAEYEWAQHSRIAKSAGMSDAEILRLIEGPDAAGWSEIESALLRAVDELHADAFVTDGTWNTLAAHYSEKQMMDIVFTVGQYNLVSMALNSFGVQLDEGLTGFPK